MDRNLLYTGHKVDQCFPPWIIGSPHCTCRIYIVYSTLSLSKSSLYVLINILSFCLGTFESEKHRCANIEVSLDMNRRKSHWNVVYKGDVNCGGTAYEEAGRS